MRDPEKKQQHRMTGSGAWITIPEDSLNIRAWSEDGPALLAQAKTRIAAGGDAFHPHDVDDSSFLSDVVYSLELDYGAFITGMYCDQWAAISARKHDNTFGVWAECDQLEHGLAAVWLAFADRAVVAAR